MKWQIEVSAGWLRVSSCVRLVLVLAAIGSPGAVAASGADLVTPSAEQLLREATESALNEADLPSTADGFRTALLASTEWQHEIFDSGPVPDRVKVLAVLHAIWQADASFPDRPLDRAMATACGLEGARRYGAEGMVERYQFFRDHWQDGRLNDLYESLSVFERRFLANGVQHGHFNTLASMEYQLTEVSLPADRYTGACWYAGYRLHNPFGDSIHGPHYYRPFQSSWSSAAEMVRNVGGVCGSLSNFGAAAAIANGVPAVTMGEPGHCAYAVMVATGKWQPAYSLSWQRGVHTTFYGGSWGWHLFAVASQASPEQAWAAGDHRRRGEWYLAKGEVPEAVEVFAEGCRNYPLDYPLWQARVKAIEELQDPYAAWRSFHDDVLGGLAASYPEVAWELLHRHAYPQLLQPEETQVEDRQQILLSFHRPLAGWGSCRWDFPGALRRQQQLLGADAKAQDAYAVAVFRVHADDPTLAAAVLETELAALSNEQQRRQQFLAAVLESVGPGEATASSDTITMLARKLLPDSAAAGDKATFQFIGQLASAAYKPCDVSAEAFPGILLSSGGTLAIAGAGNRYDVPEQHWGVIEPYGGYFHTAAKPATVTVQLGNFGRLTGVVIVQRPGHIGRLDKARLQVSADGKDWADVFTFNNPQRVERIDLQGRGIDAGFVRVLQEHGESLHFNRFLVFGTKQN